MLDQARIGDDKAGIDNDASDIITVRINALCYIQLGTSGALGRGYMMLHYTNSGECGGSN